MNGVIRMFLKNEETISNQSFYLFQRIPVSCSNCKKQTGYVFSELAVRNSSKTFQEIICGKVRIPKICSL